jgi:hypothetical protein
VTQIFLELRLDEGGCSHRRVLAVLAFLRRSTSWLRVSRRRPLIGRSRRHDRAREAGTVVLDHDGSQHSTHSAAIIELVFERSV